VSARLIVTADDLGLHQNINQGVFRAHREGIVAAASIVANGEAFDDAVGRLRDTPALQAGVHLAFVEERPLSPLTKVDTLVDGTGAFHRNFRRFVVRYATGNIDRAQLAGELRRQIERVVAAGVRVTHLNSHQHLHMLPDLFDLTLDLASEYAVPYVRVVSDPLRLVPSPRNAALAGVALLGWQAKRKARNRVATNERTIGIAAAGRGGFRTDLARIRGLTELVVHPGVGSGHIAKRYDWGYCWDAELEALCDPLVRRSLADLEIELTRPSEV
jgi:chitin disaccharide deacetylase